MNRFARLAALGSATVGEAWPAARVIAAPPRPLAPGMVVAGPALTVRCQPGDNLALHRAIARAAAGQVLVVDYGGSTDSAPFGEIMALACQMRGIAGLVIDGAVRDGTRITELGFPVFARGLDPRGSTKRDGGAIGVPLTLGGASIAPGEVLVADADGIVVVAADQLDAVLTAGAQRAAREAQIMARLRAGETTLAILGLQAEEEDGP